MKKDNQESNKVFPGQRDGESFLFMFRRHIIAMRKGFYSFLIIFALSCLPTFIFMTMDMLWILFKEISITFLPNIPFRVICRNL